MVCILFNKVLYVSPLDALWTIAGRSKPVYEAVEFDVILPLDGVVLIFGCRPAAEVEGIVSTMI